MADQPVRFNPVGNMDKDADPRYVRQGNYLDAKNIQKLTEKGGTGGAVIPVKGNEHAFDLGDVVAQSKKYRIEKFETDNRYTPIDFTTTSKSGFYTSITFSFTSPPAVSIGDIITISGALPSALNGTFTVTYISNTGFSIGYIVAAATNEVWTAQIPTNTTISFPSTSLITVGSFQIQFWSMNEDQLMSSISNDGTVLSIQNGIDSSNLGPYTVTSSTSEYVEVELTGYDYYDYYIKSTGDNYLKIYSIQEAIPKNVAGPLKANGSHDLLGDLFITSSTIDLEPIKLSLIVNDVSLTGPITNVTFTSAHNFQVGDWVGIRSSNASWLNGVFLIQEVPSSTQIGIVTAIAWQTAGSSYDLFDIGEEEVYLNPKSIGEIGVATYNQDSDVWTYTRLLRSMQLSFVLEHANDITGRDDIRRKTLYYTDDFNNRRAFYYYGDYETDGALNFINSENFYYYDIVSEQSEVSAAQIGADVGLYQQMSGGSMKSGNKRYFCYLVDFFGNQSAYSYLSNIVSAYSASPSGTAYGDDAGVNTGKLNRILISDIDRRFFQYISLGYVDYVEDVVTASVLSEQDITANSMVINHNGSETAFIIDLADIPISLQKTPKKALNVDVIDNRLVFSNLQEETKRDIRDWAKTFKHRIKNKFINESTKFQMGEYQDVHTIHDDLGYMINETYRFGVQVRWTDNGQWSEAAWVDDVKVDFDADNTVNPFNDNRREQTGNNILTNYDLTNSIYDYNNQLPYPEDPVLGGPVDPSSGVNPRYPSTARVKVAYVEFFGFDFTYEINGEPLSNLIDKIKIVRVECIPEVLATGASVLTVGMGSTVKDADIPGQHDGTFYDVNYTQNQMLDTSNYLSPGFEPELSTVTFSNYAGKSLDIQNPTFPLAYGFQRGDIYRNVLPSICLTEHTADPPFNWKTFKGTFHEYPFAYGSPVQAGIRPIYFFDYGGDFVSNRSRKDYQFYIDSNSYYNQFGLSLDGEIDPPFFPALSLPNTPHVTNNFRRCWYSGEILGPNPTSPTNYYSEIANLGYPDFTFRGNIEFHNITPLYYYGEDANPASLPSSGQNFVGGFTGQHGQPFGTIVRLANEQLTRKLAEPSATAYDNVIYKYYPFWVNRRILSIYAPDLLLGQSNVESSANLHVFGEYRVSKFHQGDFVNGLFVEDAVVPSGYTEYGAENFGTTYDEYDIQSTHEIGDGGSDSIYPDAKFRKGYSAHARNWEGSGAGDLDSQPYSKYENLWKNKGGLVVRVDGDSNPALRDSLEGVKSPNKNTDYGVYYVHLFQENRGKYGATGDSIYIDTGNSFRVNQLTFDVDGLVEKDQIKVFGGDTFTQSFYLGARRVNGDLAEGGWNTDDFSNTTQGPGWGGGMKFYSQNRINAQMRTDDADAFLYPSDTSSQGAWLQDYESNFGFNFRYNPSYTPENGILSYNSINDRLLKQQTDLPSRIDYSQKYEQQTLDDKNQSFLPLNFKDIDQTFGEIISHKNVNGELFTLQPRKFQAQYFHATGQLQTDVSEGLNIVIGDGAVLSRDGQTLSAYGTQHKWSVVKGRSPGGKDVIYWFNQESKLIMRFGADGTVVLSDVKGLRSFLENDARWTEGEDSPYVNQGIRSVWDDEYKEAIWTWRGYRASGGVWETPPDHIAITYNVGDTVAYSTYNNYPFEQIPDVYICTQEHSSSVNSPNTPGSSRFWELVSKDDGDYYSNFTLAFNEMTNGFSSFYSHMPKIYFPWKNKFLSAHPTQEQKIYEHRKGEYTTWYTTQVDDERPIELSEDAYIEGIVNYLPESSKKFVATQVISDNEPDRMEFKTFNQESFLNKGEFDDHDDHWRSPIKNDSTVSGDPSGDTKSLMGDFIKVKFFFTKKTYNRLYNFVVKLRERLRIYRS